MLDEVASWPIGSIHSPASSTDEWLDEAERTRIFEDTYVSTGNVKYRGKSLGASGMNPVWKTDWNDRLGTVLPEPVLEKTDEHVSAGQRPAVAHVIPPHAPYVAQISDLWLPTVPDAGTWAGNPNDSNIERVSAQVAMASGQVDMQRAKEGYIASIESTWNIVEEYIAKWVSDGLDVVLTADHGEAFGTVREFGLMGHPNRCHISALTKVPFEKFSAEENDTAVADSTRKKLQALGYAE